MRQHINRFAIKIATISGNPYSFLVGLLLIVLWASSGPLFHFNDTWQLIINTSTTIITFLMTLLIQNTQNRDTEALHKKLDELIRVNKKASDNLIAIEKKV